MFEATPPSPVCWQSNGAAAEASATSILGIDHATKLSPIPSLAEIHCLLETAGRNVLKVANSLGHEVPMLSKIIY